MAIIYNGTYTNGITLDDPATQAVVLITGRVTHVNADAIYGAPGYAWDVINSGTIANTGTAGQGIDLKAGGSATNDSGGSISGVIDGVLIAGAAGTVGNSGTIAGSKGIGVYLDAGGKVTNGSTSAAAASISGVFGVVVQGALGTIANFGTIAGAPAGYASEAVYLGAGGNLSNGRAAPPPR